MGYNGWSYWASPRPLLLPPFSLSRGFYVGMKCIILVGALDGAYHVTSGFIWPVTLNGSSRTLPGQKFGEQ